MAVQEEAFKAPEPMPVLTKCQTEAAPAEKPTSDVNNMFKSVESDAGNDCSSTPSKKKRSLKAQTKKQSKKTENKKEVLIPLTKQSMSLP